MSRIISTLFVCVLFVITGCKRNLQEIIEDTKQATVTVYTFDEYGSPLGSGSAFFIDKSGTAITNYHVLDGATKATVKTFDGKEFEIDSVLVSNRKKDIIKFSLKNDENHKFKYLTFADEAPQQGDKVYNISSPLGLEQTFSDGVISATRSDFHGEVIQITAPISPGSSGSAIINEKGEVVAVATYLMKGGQNLNFGVRLSGETLPLITENDFAKRNSKFNSKGNFIIINSVSTNTPNLRLNAIEFKKDATVAYFSLTNLDMTMPEMPLYIPTDKGDKGLCLKDIAGEKTYHVTSSSVGAEKKDAEIVALATTKQFKVYFPAIKNPESVSEVDIVDGVRGWKFNGIDLDECRNSLHYDMESFQKNYAYSRMHEGDLGTPLEIFSQILEDNPEDEDALNAIGIISYVQGNMKDALDCFSEAIETHPTSDTGYNNRAYLYLSQEQVEKAMADLKKSVSINPSGDNYLKRAGLYMALENWSEANSDLTKALETEKYKDDAGTLTLRAICAMRLNRRQQAIDDFQRAYKLTDDPELEQQIEAYYELL